MSAAANERDRDTTVLAPRGELGLAAVPRLRARLSAAHRPGATVVLDLSDVTLMDSSALFVVVLADRALRPTGGALRLVHVADDVLRVLRICGLADRLVGRPGRLVLLPSVQRGSRHAHGPTGRPATAPRRPPLG